MRGSTRTTSFLLILCLATLAGPASAGYEDGVIAFNRGDYGTAQQELALAAEQGDPSAQFMLGFMLGYGRGVPMDPVKAADWYWKAAGQGVTPAATCLARMYEDGSGVPRDLAQAYRWYGHALDRLGPGLSRISVAAGRDRVAREISDAELIRLRQTADADLPAAPAPPASAAPDEGSPEAAAAPAAAPAKRRASRGLVERVQRELAGLGYDVGEIDGMAGAQTDAALQAFQMDQGWPPRVGITEVRYTELLMVRRAAEAAAVPTAPEARSPEVRSYTGDVVGTIDARLQALQQIVQRVDSITAATHGFLLLDRWEGETRDLLAQQVGAERAAAVGRWESDLVFGDIYGNFQRRAEADRLTLLALREEIERRPYDYYALHLGSL